MKVFARSLFSGLLLSCVLVSASALAAGGVTSRAKIATLGAQGESRVVVRLSSSQTIYIAGSDGCAPIAPAVMSVLVAAYSRSADVQLAYTLLPSNPQVFCLTGVSAY